MEQNNQNRSPRPRPNTQRQSTNNAVKRPNNTVRRKRKKRNSKDVLISTLIYVAFIFATSGILSLIAIKWSNDIFAFSKEDNEITIKIPDNASVKDVSKILDNSGVIEFNSLFKLFVNFSASGAEFTEGTHTLNSNMDYRGILNDLSKTTLESSNAIVKVTIPEGDTIEQIAVRLEEAEVVTQEEFLDTIVNYEFAHDFLTINNDVIYQLEGYLFPDTYEFYIGDNPISVINKMLNNFGAKIDGEVMVNAEKLGLTLHEVVTIASLVEREAAKQDEQAKISGVIHNRLNNSSEYPYLNIDATIQYAVGHKEALTASDLKIDSPYNSYTFRGMPPGPIANPGLSTLIAAVQPESHGYYYYVAKPDGYHIFTSSLAEHNAAVAEARSMFN